MTPQHWWRALRLGTWRMVLTGRSAEIVQRIMDRCEWVDRGYHEGPCLEWQGPTSGSNGRGKDYPRWCLDGQTVAVHRCFWVCLHGYLPGKKQLDHLCRNRRCVLHCEPVTHRQNQKRRDAARRASPCREAA